MTKNHKRSLRPVVLATVVAFLVSSVPHPAVASRLIHPLNGDPFPLLEPTVTADLVGLQIAPAEPYRLDFLFDLDPGGSTKDLNERVKSEAEEAARYFMTVLTLPDEAVWVNLSPRPDEPVMDPRVEGTRLGDVMLEADLRLKKAVARRLDPEGETGRRFWSALHERGLHPSVGEGIMKRIWVTARRAVVAVEGQRVWIDDCRLGLELKGEEAAARGSAATDALVKEILFPVLERDINESKEFRGLRRIFRVTVLAVWYKRYLMRAVLARLFAQRGVRGGLETLTPQRRDELVQEYLRSYGVGEFNRVRVEREGRRALIRRYQAGGMKPAASVADRLNSVSGGRPSRWKSVLHGLVAVALLFNPVGTPVSAEPAGPPAVAGPSAAMRGVDLSDDERPIPPAFDFSEVPLEMINTWTIDLMKTFFEILISRAEDDPSLWKDLRLIDPETNRIRPLARVLDELMQKRPNDGRIFIFTKVYLDRGDGLSAWIDYVYRWLVMKRIKLMTGAVLYFPKYRDVIYQYDTVDQRLLATFKIFGVNEEEARVIRGISSVEQAKAMLFFDAFLPKLWNDQSAGPVVWGSRMAPYVSPDFEKIISDNFDIFLRLAKKPRGDKGYFEWIEVFVNPRLRRYGLFIDQASHNVYRLVDEIVRDVDPPAPEAGDAHSLYKLHMMIRIADIAVTDPRGWDGGGPVLGKVLHAEDQLSLFFSPELLVTAQIFPGVPEVVIHHELMHVRQAMALWLWPIWRDAASIALGEAFATFEKDIMRYRFVTEKQKTVIDVSKLPDRFLVAVFDEEQAYLQQLIDVSVPAEKTNEYYLMLQQLGWSSREIRSIFDASDQEKLRVGALPRIIMMIHVMKEAGALPEEKTVFTKQDLEKVMLKFLSIYVNENDRFRHAARKVAERLYGKWGKLTAVFDPYIKGVIREIEGKLSPYIPPPPQPFRFPHTIWRSFHDALKNRFGPATADAIKKNGLAHYDRSRKRVVFFDENGTAPEQAERIWRLALDTVRSGDPYVKTVDDLKRLIVFHETLHVGFDDNKDLERFIAEGAAQSWPQDFWQAFEETYGKPTSAVEKSEHQRWRVEEFVVLFGQEVYFKKRSAEEWIRSWYGAGRDHDVRAIITAVEELYTASAVGRRALDLARDAMKPSPPGGVDFKTVPLVVSGDVMQVPVPTDLLRIQPSITGVEIRFMGWQWIVPPGPVWQR